MKPKLFWIQIWTYQTFLPHKYKNKIGPIEIFVCCVLTLLSLCPVGCLSLALIFHWGDLILILWIQNNNGFIVSDLMYILSAFLWKIGKGTFWTVINCSDYKFWPSITISSQNSSEISTGKFCHFHFKQLFITSESKKPGQITLVIQYCNLSRFFLTQTLINF